MKRRTKIILSIVGAVLFLGTAGAVWLWTARGPVLRDIALNIKAGVQSRHAAKPFERYLELRYGPMNEATNRQKVFTGFFDPTHIQGMHRLVSHMKDAERQKNIAATAEWLANHRQAMSEPEKQALADWLRSDEGRQDIQKASALFRSQDIHYRAATEPVIRELMTTLATIHQKDPEQ